MEVMEAILTRRSIRRYSDKKVKKEIVDKIIRAAMYAPSAVNKQPWHFIVFEDKETCRQIIDLHKSAKMLAEAPVSVLVCYDENLEHDKGYGLLDCSAATQNMLLCAHSIGLGSCWIGIYPRENRISGIVEIFNLPNHIKPLAIVALGYPDESKQTSERFRKDRIRYEKW